MTSYLEKLDDEIRFRAPNHLKKRLKKIAKVKREKYQKLVRDVIYRYVEESEKAN